MKNFAVLVIGFLVWPFVAMWRAYAITILWGWFVLPATNIVAPSIYFIVGMMMTLGMILPIRKEPKQEGDALGNYFGNLFAYGLCLPASVLGCGWIWKWLQWGVV